MKKMIVLLLLAFTVSAANAQETKFKRTSSPRQKVHNVFHKNKHYNGYKIKHKNRYGHKTKRTVRNGHVHVKSHSMVMRKEELVA